jgi:hypothetical protein
MLCLMAMKARAGLELDWRFSDHMVLQRGSRIAVTGTGG